MEQLLGPLFVSVLLEVGTAEGLPVLNNTDFPSNCGNDPYHPSTGIQECGTLCENRTDCVAVIFAPPAGGLAGGSAGDAGACAFKCRSDNPVHKDGIRAIVVRPHKVTCPPPPAPPPAPPPFAPPSAGTDPDWLVRYEAANLLYANSALNASLFPYAGNGYLATHPVGGRGSKGGDGGSTMTALQKMSTLYVSGVFNGVAVQSPCEGGYCAAPRRAAVPTYRAVLADVPLLGDGSRYALDLEKATLARRVALEGGLEVEERWFAHLVNRSLLVHEITASNSGDTPQSLAILAVFGGADRFEPGSFIFTNSTSGGVHSVLGATNHSERPELPKTQVVMCSNAVAAGERLEVAVGETQTVRFVSAVATSLESTDPKASAMQALQAALAPGVAEGLLASHEAAWKERWDQGRVEVGGNLALAQAINASQYFMLSSVRADWPFGMSPGGLASDGYQGHTFWDQEFWMVPTMILLHPDIARSCLQYRLDRLEGAKSKARSQGFAGHMWPCESALSGYEVQGSGGNGTGSATARGIGGEGDYGLYEQHWNSDISFAFWQFWQASGNLTDLKENLEPVLRGTAEFWVSRVETHKGHGGPVDGQYHINHVMPPDEYVDGVDDEVYTNFGAKSIIYKASQAAIAAGRRPGSNWTAVADKIFINYDEQEKYHPEYVGFKPNVLAPPDERNGDGSTHVKQGDVVLIGFPYDATMSTAVRKNDLLTYYNCTDKVSVAMTWGSFAVGWLEVAQQEKDAKDRAQAQAFAQQRFEQGYANIKPPFGVWTEKPGADGGTVNFITGAGGFLQSVVFGYAGLRLREERLDLLQPPLPNGTASLTLRGLHYRGNKILLEVNAARVTVEVMQQTGAKAGAASIALELCLPNGEITPLLLGKTRTFLRGIAASIRPAGTCERQ